MQKSGLFLLLRIFCEVISSFIMMKFYEFLLQIITAFKPFILVCVEYAVHNTKLPSQLQCTKTYLLIKKKTIPQATTSENNDNDNYHTRYVSTCNTSRTRRYYSLAVLRMTVHSHNYGKKLSNAYLVLFANKIYFRILSLPNSTSAGDASRLEILLEAPHETSMKTSKSTKKSNTPCESRPTKNWNF